MPNRKRCSIILISLILSLVLLASCGTRRTPQVKEPDKEPNMVRQQSQRQVRQEQTARKPKLPEALGQEAGKEPSLKVYIVQEETVKEMPFEEYVAGVVAGEIKNDWPEEAIKAQAIIARTFVLQFIDEKGQSKYENAHVSTDIEEAQAWNYSAVNDRIKKAVEETRGQVIVYNGEFARTWFHSNAGGKTATPKEGLNYKDEDPPYIQVVDSPDTSESVEADAKNWSVKFPKDKVLNALQSAGKPVKDFSSVQLGKKGPSGRAVTIKFDQTEVSAAELRLALGTTEMRSTLIDKIALEGNYVVMSGRGYGHGVGMSQWGAYTMAKEGKSAQDIINHYFKDIDIVKMWD